MSRLTKAIAYGVASGLLAVVATVVIIGLMNNWDNVQRPSDRSWIPSSLYRLTQPDRCVVRGGTRDYTVRHPGPADVALAFEVADSSLDDDRAQADIDGRAGSPVYWIINLIDRQVEVYSTPQLFGLPVAGSDYTAAYPDGDHRRRRSRGDPGGRYLALMAEFTLGDPRVNDSQGHELPPESRTNRSRLGRVSSAWLCMPFAPFSPPFSLLSGVKSGISLNGGGVLVPSDAPPGVFHGESKHLAFVVRDDVAWSRRMRRCVESDIGRLVCKTPRRRNRYAVRQAG